MTRTLLAVLVLAAIAAFGVHQLRSGTDTTATRASSAPLELLDAMEPDSTFHLMRTVYERPSPGAPSDGSFVLPERYEQEIWAYFDDQGDLTTIMSAVRDTATQEVIQVARVDGSDLVVTDVASGQTRVVGGYRLTINELAARIERGTSSLRADELVESRSVVSGRPALVLESNDDPSGERVVHTVDPETYLPIVTERYAAIESQQVLLARTEFGAFEVLDGNQIPAE